MLWTTEISAIILLSDLESWRIGFRKQCLNELAFSRCVKMSSSNPEREFNVRISVQLRAHTQDAMGVLEFIRPHHLLSRILHL